MFAFFVRGQKREDDKMEEGEEAVGRVEDEAEDIEANQTLSRHLQFFQWEWALLRNRELVSWKAYLIKWDLWDDCWETENWWVGKLTWLSETFGMIMLQYIFLHVHVNGNQYLWQIVISTVIFWFIFWIKGKEVLFQIMEHLEQGTVILV